MYVVPYWSTKNVQVGLRGWRNLAGVSITKHLTFGHSNKNAKKGPKSNPTEKELKV